MFLAVHNNFCNFFSCHHKFRFWAQRYRSKRLQKIRTLPEAYDCFLLKSIVGTYKCEGFNSFEFKNISFLSENCKFIDTSLVDSTFDSCTFDVNALQNVAFIGCKFIDCKVKKENSLQYQNIHCYGCEDFNKGFRNCFELIQE